MAIGTLNYTPQNGVKEEAKMSFIFNLQIFSSKRNIIKCLEDMYSFMKSFQIVEIREVFCGERGVDF